MNTEKQPMECEIRQLGLKNLLDRARGAVGRMHPYFLIDVYMARITCCATDLTVGIVSEIERRDPDTITMGGTICVPAGKFYDIIAALPDKPVKLKLPDNSRLQISCGSYSGVIPCVNPADFFPDMIIPGGAPDTTCSGSFLNDIFAAIGHAIGNDAESATSGMHLRAENGRLVGTATNGHRLSVAAVTVPYDDECESFNTGVTISPRALGEIKKLCCGYSDIRFRDNRMSIEQINITVIARLFEKAYPDYRRVIPTNHPHCTVVNARGFIEAVERVKVLSESDGITLCIGQNEIGITGESTAGVIVDTMDCETSGDATDIRITPGYLLESLKSLTKDSEDVIIKYSDAFSPVLILPADHSNWDERIELIVPRRA